MLNPVWEVQSNIASFYKRYYGGNISKNRAIDSEKGEASIRLNGLCDIKVLDDSSDSNIYVVCFNIRNGKELGKFEVPKSLLDKDSDQIGTFCFLKMMDLGIVDREPTYGLFYDNNGVLINKGIIPDISHVRKPEKGTWVILKDYDYVYEDDKNPAYIIKDGVVQESKRTRKPVSRQTRRFESRSIRRRFNEAEESNVIYTAKFADFYSEEDSYEEGVIGGGTQWDIGLDLEAKTLDELFRKVKKALYMDGKGYYWGVELSDMNGQTCFMVDYEGNGDNDLASEDEIEAWKNGEERLWLVRGCVQVMKTVKPSNVPDDEMEAFARANGLDIMQ